MVRQGVLHQLGTNYDREGLRCLLLLGPLPYLVWHKIAGQRTLFLSIHDDEQLAEIFLRVKRGDCFSELISLYDIITHLMSLALQYRPPFGDLLEGAKFVPCDPVVTHDRLKQASLPDLIGRHLSVEYCGRGDLAHCQNDFECH